MLLGMYSMLLFFAWLTASPAATLNEFDPPKDPKFLVIEAVWSHPQLPRKNKRPALTVAADGTVTVNDHASDRSATMVLEAAELQRLLSDIVDEHKFFEFDAAAVAQQVADLQKGKAVEKLFGLSLDLTIRTPGKEHTVTYAALADVARRYRNLQPVKNLHAVEEKLGALSSIAWAGGAEGMKKYLKAANERLASEFPDLKPLTIKDHRPTWIGGFVERIDGADPLTTVHFFREFRPSVFVSVAVTRSPNGQYAVPLMRRNFGADDYDVWAKDRFTLAKCLDLANEAVQKRTGASAALTQKDLIVPIKWHEGGYVVEFRRGDNLRESVSASIAVYPDGKIRAQAGR